MKARPVGRAFFVRSRAKLTLERSIRRRSRTAGGKRAPASRPVVRFSKYAARALKSDRNEANSRLISVAISCFISCKIMFYKFHSIVIAFVDSCVFRTQKTVATLHVDDLFELIERLGKADRIDLASDIIGDFLKAWGLHNVAYAALNMPSPAGGAPLLAMTYCLEWQKHYAQKGYVDIDPIVRSGFGGILPTDWEMINREDPIIRRFFGEAQELDVGVHGMSIPIRGRHGEFALFTVTANVNLSEWEAMRRDLLRELMVVAWHFHAAALGICGAEGSCTPVHLPLREASCLRWKALGKKDGEIAQILSISPHTVRFHLESARARLNTANTMHTVAKALSLGLINMSYEPSHLMSGKRGGKRDRPPIFGR
jgi:DNA-binding CsgD family transcriptional regulator